MLLADAGAALAADGQPTLNEWPYDQSLGGGTADPPTSLGPPPWYRARLDSVAVANDGIEAEIETAMDSRLPVVLIVEVTDEFVSVADDGIVRMPNIRARVGAYHAVLAVGAATHPLWGRMLLIKNSWGTEWGEGGFAWLPLSYLAAFGVDAAVVP